MSGKLKMERQMITQFFGNEAVFNFPGIADRTLSDIGQSAGNRLPLAEIIGTWHLIRMTHYRHDEINNVPEQHAY